MSSIPHFKQAIVRTPCREMVHGLTSANLGAPDYERALDQHAGYVEALRKCGLAVTVLDADPRFPDSTFVEDTALLRLEQLYPFPAKYLDRALKRYPGAGEIWWVQEEPENMGAWGYLLRSQPGLGLGLISRRENSAAESGFFQVHVWEQEGIVAAAFGRSEGEHRGVTVRPAKKRGSGKRKRGR